MINRMCRTFIGAKRFFLIKERLVSDDEVVGALFKMKRDVWGV